MESRSLRAARRPMRRELLSGPFSPTLLASVCLSFVRAITRAWGLLLLLLPLPAAPVEVWLATENLDARLERQADVPLGADATTSTPVPVNDSISYQEMDGFGVSLTDSAAWLLSQRLGDEKRVEAMEALFKFVRPGAHRIEAPNWEGQLETVGFQNPDGSIALVTFNRQFSPRSVRVIWKNNAFTHQLPPRSLMTFSLNKPELPAITGHQRR